MHFISTYIDASILNLQHCCEFEMLPSYVHYVYHMVCSIRDIIGELVRTWLWGSSSWH